MHAAIGLMLLVPMADPELRNADPAQLCEVLADRQNPRQQSQAALLLVQHRAPEAEEAVRRGLRQTESPEVFLALCSAVRLSRDKRFVDELFEALASGQPAVRQEAGDTLAAQADAAIDERLRALAADNNLDIGTRQSAIAALGRSGRKSAAVVLLEVLAHDQQELRQAARDALTELTGQDCGGDICCWRAWWQGHRHISEQQWTEERLAYRASRARRLAGELERARAQIVQLHQQLHSRLTAADRLGHVQSLADHEDAAVRALAVNWSVELLSSADAVGQRVLADILLRFSRDSAVEVQRAAVLALGRVADPRAFDRLGQLMRDGAAPVRAAAARSLTQQAKLSKPAEAPAEGRKRQKQVVAALHRALGDPALEVVVEAAEDLGSLGCPEAVPVLASLLHHPSEPVRQTAARALERVADPAVLDDVLSGLDNADVTIRFSLVGAIGHALAEGNNMDAAQRARVLSRLETVLQRDADPGVRSRAATVLGTHATADALPILWKRMQATEDPRVQDKAWAAVIEIVARAASFETLQQWETRLIEAKQGTRRLELLTSVLDSWKKLPTAKLLIPPATEALVQAQLDEGKWAAAFPNVRDLLKQPGTDADVRKRLRWLLAVGDLALKEGNKAEVRRVVQEAQPFLPRARELAGDFERLEQAAPI
ncbi:MAG: HEAT repeat domain-containing protein [Gemmataceae bacterium]